MIKIDAQVYLTKFYQSCGFIQSSEEYIEDGIPHIEIILRNNLSFKAIFYTVFRFNNCGLYILPCLLTGWCYNHSNYPII